MIKDFLDEFKRYKGMGQKAIDQVPEEALNRVFGEENNSISVVVRHISGNLVSRFTDFLTTDGEKPWRHRDSEFEYPDYNREQLTREWSRGWAVVEQELVKLSDVDLSREVTIRGQALSVHAALCRSIAHIAYHVGQIILIARIIQEKEWEWITIPKGKSREYNQNPDKEKQPR